MLSRMNSRGKVISGCAVETSDGIKVADATWTSPEFLRSQHQGITYSIAPELCVEVQETADDAERFSVKRALYFEKGAQEVWICNLEGDVAFYNAQGEIRSSDLFPDFPKHVDLD
ncbi:MAG: hypothetical protein JWN70_7153 [Planctomycetaceae bacterium]|nr:hypothetical protein [Planctomycetaceae bacterium]